MSETQTESLDLSEKGLKDGQPTSLDRRLFMKFTAFTGCTDADAAGAALAAAGVEGAMYLDANDPQGIGLVAMNEDPDYFVTTLREVFNAPPFATLTHKPEFDMLWYYIPIIRNFFRIYTRVYHKYWSCILCLFNDPINGIIRKTESNKYHWLIKPIF